MNFFGHATVAHRRRSVPGFVLGAMLPDFATMLRQRPPRTAHLELGDGLSFHHRTDAVFHDAPAFLALTADAFRELTRLGLPRGPARAVAHVGVELVIDTVLAHDGDAVAAYRDALGAAHPQALGAEIAWHEHDAPERFEELRRVLSSREPSRSHVAPELVAARLRRAFAARPRLCFDDRGESIVTEWCAGSRARIGERTPELIAEVEGAL